MNRLTIGTLALTLALGAALPGCDAGADPGAEIDPAAGTGDDVGTAAPSPDDPADPMARGTPGPDVDAICDTINNSFRCARAVERRMLPGADRATRQGDTLFLALETADTVTLVDDSVEAGEVTYYSYQDHWRGDAGGAGWFVVQKQYYEGSEYLVINDSTGERTTIPNRPLLAPDRERFAVLSLDLEAGYGPNVLQVWSLGGDGPERVWQTEPDAWGPADGDWADATTLRFTQHGYCDRMGMSGQGMCERPATLTRAGGDWNLDVEAANGG